MVDINCSSFSTVCISDENELYMWGKSVFTRKEELLAVRDPECLWKDNEEASILQIFQDDYQTMDKVFAMNGVGIVFTTKTSKYKKSNFMYRILA